ncbi:hypothetical protein F5B17DRAFT_443131 [Nemania serpens]|nr:hypothetical protein F5B17DRAFT_443131 [Nemania serpens]
MGHQESSSSPPHHHHHRHHHNHNHSRRYSHRSAARTANRHSAWSLERLNRESYAPNRDAVVESWLGQVAAPVPLTQLVSPESRNHLVHRGKRPRPKERHISPCRQHAEGVDPLWRSQRIPPSQGSSPPCPPLLMGNSRRYTRSSGDSSLIGGLSPRRELGDGACMKTISEHEESSHYKPQEEAEVEIPGARSPTFYATAAPVFEKRLRHKTRADKYDAKKLGSRKKRKKPPDQERHPPRKSKSRRKHLVTGKHVMNNFTSEAVLGDRITVKPGLKPGMFDNKRVPERLPITDLSFSEMPLPASRERDVQQQKELSNSRLRERRRENQELERVSSFFLPACANATSRKVKPHRPKHNEGARCNKVTRRDDVISLATPSSPRLPAQGHHQHSSISQEHSCSLPTVTPSNPIHGSGLSRTTYITWSSSQPSPKAGRDLVDTQPRSIEPPSLTTPENIRRALIATGVYENTGIHSYDVSSYRQKLGRKSSGELTSTPGSIVDHVDTCEAQVSAEDQGSKMKSLFCSDVKDTATLLSRQEERWNTILPPEWRVRGLSDVEMSSTGRQQNDKVTGIPENVEPPSRQKIAQEARFNPLRAAQRAHCHVDHKSDTNSPSTAVSLVPVPPEPERIADQDEPADQDRDTIASRDAMPPPPLPPTRSNYSHLTNREPGNDTSSPMRLGTTRPLDTHVPVPNYEHPQPMDPDTVTEKPHEVGGEYGRVNPALNSVSWTPQIMTLNPAISERDALASRLSTRSPIYEAQDQQNNSRRDLHLNPQTRTPMAESMADFIARIESEIEESTYLDEYCQSEPIAQSQGNSLGPETSANDTYNRQPIASGGPQIDYGQLPSHTPDPRFRAASQTGHTYHGYEGPAGCLKEGSATMVSEILKDNIDEFVEMSNFWRPNRFSQF